MTQKRSYIHIHLITSINLGRLVHVLILYLTYLQTNFNWHIFHNDQKDFILNCRQNVIFMISFCSNFDKNGHFDHPDEVIQTLQGFLVILKLPSGQSDLNSWILDTFTQISWISYNSFNMMVLLKWDQNPFSCSFWGFGPSHW